MSAIYTRTGDSGMTALRDGARVRKDHMAIEANGAIDEAQAGLGLARAQSEPGSDLDALLVSLERDLWVVMAEVAAGGSRARASGSDAVGVAMVEALERHIDEVMAGLELSRDFAVPGGGRLSEALDHARTVVRRAEWRVVSLELVGLAVPSYLNRLSDLCWALARSVEQEHLVAGGRGAGRRLTGSGPAGPGARRPAGSTGSKTAPLAPRRLWRPAPRRPWRPAPRRLWRPAPCWLDGVEDRALGAHEPWPWTCPDTAEGKR